ncbi:MAG TPA: pyridine nucleotide-disulfide oxidoreductase [Treponema sp.]|nr:pyridine nucleotide-disulfide oxidoreductase [Treponema sp.]
MSGLIYDAVIVGGGPAGLAAAVSAYDTGAHRLLILERDSRLGGILLQCIHNGFGLHYFGEELTGPEYAGRFVKQAEERGIEYKVNTMVVSIDKAEDFEEAGLGASISAGGTEHVVTAMNSADGLMFLRTRAVILATGCRERTRGALVIPGTRPAGIFTAGSAQRFVNIDGYLPGRKIVILGSGDIGLIMARRLTLEGCDVKLVCEVMPYSAGLSRNMTQCLENFRIPLRLNTTVTEIYGRERVEGVTIAKVDAGRRAVPGTEEFIECDTLLLSVGLIPENEVSTGIGVHMDPVTKGPSVNQRMETSVPGIFACGNSVHVHDLVDFVTNSSLLAGRCAAEYAAAAAEKRPSAVQGKHAVVIPIRPGDRVRYTVPQQLDMDDEFTSEAAAAQQESVNTAAVSAAGADTVVPKVRIMFRSTDVYRGVTISVYSGSDRIFSKKARIVRPGEMQTAEIPVSALVNVTAPLTVSIETPEDTID